MNSQIRSPQLPPSRAQEEQKRETYRSQLQEGRDLNEALVLDPPPSTLSSTRERVDTEAAMNNTSAHQESSTIAQNNLVNAGFWKERRVFITGHNGFIGSWMSLWLTQMGAEVIGYALPLPEERPSLFTALDLDPLMLSIEADIRDADRLGESIRKAAPEIILHFAAQPIVLQAFDNPLETFSTNVMGTANLLEAARKINSVQAILAYTSDKVYRHNEDNWDQSIWAYRESDPLGGKEPYGASKACAEYVIEAFYHSYFGGPSPGNYPGAHHESEMSNEKNNTQHRGIQNQARSKSDIKRPAIASLRVGNVIGGGDWSVNRLIPDAIRAFSMEKPLLIRNAHATRPWQHVLEPLRASLLLAQNLVESAQMGEPHRFAGAYNLGPADRIGISVADLADQMVALWGETAYWQQVPTEQQTPYEATYLAVDSTLAMHRLGWQPSLTLNRTLEMTMRWYKTHLSGGDIRALSLGQITETAPEIRDELMSETIYAGVPFID